MHHHRRPKGGGLHPDGLPVLRCVHLCFSASTFLEMFSPLLGSQSQSSPSHSLALTYHTCMLPFSFVTFHVVNSFAQGHPPSRPKHRASGQIDCGIRRQCSWHLSDVSVSCRRRRQRYWHDGQKQKGTDRTVLLHWTRRDAETGDDAIRGR